MVMNPNYVHRRPAHTCQTCGERSRPRRVALVNGVFVCVKCCCFRCLHALDRHTPRPPGAALRPNGHYLCPPCAAFVTDKAARNRWLALKYARMLISSPIVSRLGTIHDVIQEAAVGLMRAAEDWRPERGRFSTHAYQHARAAVNAAAYDCSLVRVPRGSRHDPRKSAEVEKRLARALEGARRLGEDYDVPGAPGLEPDAWADERPHLREAMATLTDREKFVVESRFGLRGREPLTLREVGEAWGVTSEYIRQVEKKALGRLREFMESRLCSPTRHAR